MSAGGGSPFPIKGRSVHKHISYYELFEQFRQHRMPKQGIKHTKSPIHSTAKNYAHPSNYKVYQPILKMLAKFKGY